MKRGARPILVLAALAAGACLALWLAAPAWHPSERDYPIQGIDVSHHQGRIEWGALAGQSVDFAYIKASEGGDHRDARFAENWVGAAKAGIRRGAYHFFTLCRPGAQQAANFIASAPPEPDALPPAVDLEYGGNCAAPPPRAALLREIEAFLETVERHSGKRAILYVTEDFEAAYRVSEAFDRPLWLRSIVRRPGYGARPWAIWQASNFRRVRGIAGRVDWNVIRGGLPEAAGQAKLRP
jgi:lysozyme